MVIIMSVVNDMYAMHAMHCFLFTKETPGIHKPYDTS